jgi:hypothetical protein
MEPVEERIHGPGVEWFGPTRPTKGVATTGSVAEAPLARLLLHVGISPKGEEMEAEERQQLDHRIAVTLAVSVHAVGTPPIVEAKAVDLDPPSPPQQ